MLLNKTGATKGCAGFLGFALYLYLSLGTLLLAGKGVDAVDIAWEERIFNISYSAKFGIESFNNHTDIIINQKIK